MKGQDPTPRPALGILTSPGPSGSVSAEAGLGVAVLGGTLCPPGALSRGQEVAGAKDNG